MCHVSNWSIISYDYEVEGSFLHHNESNNHFVARKHHMMHHKCRVRLICHCARVCQACLRHACVAVCRISRHLRALFLLPSPCFKNLIKKLVSKHSRYLASTCQLHFALCCSNGIEALLIRWFSSFHLMKYVGYLYAKKPIELVDSHRLKVYTNHPLR